MYRRRFRQFKEGLFDVEDAERVGRPKTFEDEKLQALLNEDSTQTQRELAEVLNLDQFVVSRRLHGMGIVENFVSWVHPHRQQRKGFLHRSVT
ncbi:hypothetical protein Trydic_g8777 [Trypoxylus dichotomus]